MIRLYRDSEGRSVFPIIGRYGPTGQYMIFVVLLGLWTYSFKIGNELT